LKISLEIFVSEQASRGINIENLADNFKDLTKLKDDDKKLTVTVAKTSN